MEKLFAKLKTLFNNHWALLKVKAIKAKRKRVYGQHQLTSTTKWNRYPSIFNETKKLTTKQNLKILSFGCSTGEECFSLRTFFPAASIIGADINSSNLKKAQKQNTDKNILFIYSNDEVISKNGPYDIIFAMSVLCRWEDTKDIENCATIYPFPKFEKSVNLFYSWLKPKGLLVVYNANFRVEDCLPTDKLVPLVIDSIEDSGFVHKFDKNNSKLYSEHKTVIYKKI